jgi:hypothetical protein
MYVFNDIVCIQCFGSLSRQIASAGGPASSCSSYRDTGCADEQVGASVLCCKHADLCY